MHEMEGGVSVEGMKGQGAQTAVEPVHHPVLLFDGVCNLCNGAVQFIIRRDRRAIIRFAPLQWEGLSHWLQTNNVETSVISSILSSRLSSDAPDTVMLVDKGKVYVKSDAALHVARYLDGGWPMLGLMGLVPRSIRNFLYDLIARNRYRWFGKREVCMIPTPDLQSRFIHLDVRSIDG